MITRWLFEVIAWSTYRTLSQRHLDSIVFAVLRGNFVVAVERCADDCDTPPLCRIWTWSSSHDETSGTAKGIAATADQPRASICKKRIRTALQREARFREAAREVEVRAQESSRSQQAFEHAMAQAVSSQIRLSKSNAMNALHTGTLHDIFPKKRDRLWIINEML